jgi:hypothetical protein
VVLLLSAMNKFCDELSPVAVTLVILAIGIFLFLLPPVPGVPIYLFAGVVMVNSLDKEFDNFWLAIWVVTVVCLCIKLTACTIQQKVSPSTLVQIELATGYEENPVPSSMLSCSLSALPLGTNPSAAPTAIVL